MGWRVATVSAARWETPTARTLTLEVPDWPGHLPGQHLDLRLTAEDGYSAQRSYSIGSAWPGTGPVEITVQRLADGEVSPYLTDVVEVGDRIELRGPIGGWFVWRSTRPAPVLLVAGGSGVVPLMSMIRQRGQVRGRQPFRLVYSVRGPEDACYADELRRRVRDDPGLDVHFVYTRRTPDGWPAPPKRIDVAVLNTHGWPPEFAPDVFVCGPTPFVETAADILVALGHDPVRVRTERFGGA
ncbi:ferredoxin-NADP reductase [Actinoplanes teichomyceticus]|uniref:Ferredoxin-NADP reductase n=2 Tax=Actinoplanes teichomyceticus TaxID=1867 RepID=A0A561VS16_ACTTI|nr:ferredoxin-NADP reductase [Actinoplanes teichomyceticus]GIF16220.1 oxidoreductase [Actinoplanes teichomyceticus]